MSSLADSIPAEQRSSLDILTRPWIFSQRRPLTTSDFIKEAKRRGVDLDLSGLRELYRIGVLAPFLEVTSRRVGDPFVLSPAGPLRYASLTVELQAASAKGRVRDPAVASFRRHVAFERPKGASLYWGNGLLYSRYQLLLLSRIEPLLVRGRMTLRSGSRVFRLPRPHGSLVEHARRLRDVAIVLGALEARYLPRLDSAWVHLQNTEFEEWEQYRASFDPLEVAAALEYPAARAQADAESLLMTANRIDPLGHEWASLARRAPHRSRDKLSGAALQAMDCREAAEILLLYYEDSAIRGAAEPLPTIPRFSFHPLHERLNSHNQSLDEDLQQLGLSPHPRVVLVVEGETEEELVPQIREYADMSLAPELIRVLTLRGVGGDLTKVAALAAAPLVGERHGDSWSLIKPPTALFIAMDPEGPYATPEDVAKVREKIIDELVRVLNAQGVTADIADLDELVHIRIWQERCFEFEHFDDGELAEAIAKVHTGWPKVDQDKLRRDVQRVRQARQNVDDVWKKWRPELSKRALARELWPILAAKIDRLRIDHKAPMPSILDALLDAENIARRWQYGSFVLRAAPRNETPTA